MFTGIVEGVAFVKEMRKRSREVLMVFQSDKVNLDGMMLGDSISINGICLTVVAFNKNVFSVEASHETLSRTNLSKLRTGSRVNIERSLKVGDRLGGHFVTGHVDGTAKIDKVSRVGESREIWISVPHNLIKYIVEKGSVAVDGVSLTVNRIEKDCFSVNIIPYTQDVTILEKVKAGDVVNIECDIIGKYVEKFVDSSANNDKDQRLKDLLKDFGN